MMSAYFAISFFTSATNSFRDFAGTLGWTTSTSGAEDTQVIGIRSLVTLNFMRLP